MEVHNQHLIDEESAALVMASLSGGKRKMDDNPDAAAGAGVPKVARGTADADGGAEGQGQPPAPAANGEAESSRSEPQEPVPDSSQQGTGGVLQPYPFFYYVDYSTEADPDPLTPLVPPGRVPNFPSKMHAILARQDLKDLITWLPHGRAWVVSNSKEFEKRVLPVYFEHQKYSSFVRQANGWGFRRITAGDDRNAYYHPRFLRGLPHLCKDMKRPGVNKKVAADPEHEPDLARISELHPLPTNAAPDDSILLHCTVQNGPKARMPIYSGSLLTSSYSNTSQQQQPNNKIISATTASAAPAWAPSDHEFLQSFQNSLGASEQQLSGSHQHHKDSGNSSSGAPLAQNGTNTSSIATNASNNQQQQPLPMSSLFPMFPTEMMPQAAAASQQEQQPPQTAAAPVPKISSLSAANQLAFANATAQFAAGFAAAMGLFAPKAPPAGTENPMAVAGGMAAAMSTVPGAASLGGPPPAAPKIAPTDEPKQPH